MHDEELVVSASDNDSSYERDSLTLSCIREMKKGETVWVKLGKGKVYLSKYFTYFMGYKIGKILWKND